MRCCCAFDASRSKDLVFLGLVCRSEHVYLLRTKPNYEKKVRPESVAQDLLTFALGHVTQHL